MDTARHYLHPDTIKDAIDVLAYNKVPPPPGHSAFVLVHDMMLIT
jgi:hypothetical protein